MPWRHSRFLRLSPLEHRGERACSRDAEGEPGLAWLRRKPGYLVRSVGRRRRLPGAPTPIGVSELGEFGELQIVDQVLLLHQARGDAEQNLIAFPQNHYAGSLTSAGQVDCVGKRGARLSQLPH